MREIKFRAWHKQNKKMHNSVNYLHFSPMGDLYGLLVEEGRLLANTDFELMQCTGAKDKNDKDGYDGDLVKMFGRSLFGIVWDEYYARFQLELVHGDEMVKVHDMGMLQFGEIIGNIYENTELLPKAGE